MAAILCRGFCDVVKGVCDAVGKVICFPCKVCGVATAELGDILCSPFFVYLSVTYGLNLPSIVFTFKAAQAGEAGDCSKVMHWLIVNAALCAINMLAAAYIVNRIQADHDPNSSRHLEEGTWYQMTGTSSNSLPRVKQILCDDPGVALYILIGIFYIIWTLIGVSRSQEGDCNNEIMEHIQNAVLFNFLFLGFGGVAFCCSLCCL